MRRGQHAWRDWQSGRRWREREQQRRGRCTATSSPNAGRQPGTSRPPSSARRRANTRCVLCAGECSTRAHCIHTSCPPPRSTSASLTVCAMRIQPSKSRPLYSHPRVFRVLISLRQHSARLALIALARPRLSGSWLSLRRAAARRVSHRVYSLPSPSSALIAVRCLQLTGPGHDNVHGQQEATGKSMCFVQLTAMSPEPRALYSLSATRAARTAFLQFCISRYAHHVILLVDFSRPRPVIRLVCVHRTPRSPPPPVLRCPRLHSSPPSSYCARPASRPLSLLKLYLHMTCVLYMYATIAV